MILMLTTITSKTITVETKINAPVEKVWKYWTLPEHICQWYQSSPEWHVPFAENTLEVNGEFKIILATKDEKVRLDFEGVYTHIHEYKKIEYVINDGRNVRIAFLSQANITKIVEIFETENIHPPDMQRAEWQAILDNFKEYTESK